MRTSPPHLSQVSTSILKTRFNRFAQVIEARFSAGVWSVPSAESSFLRLPRLVGVTSARYLLLGAPNVGALGEHAVKACKVYTGFGNQGNQPGDKIQWFEYHMGRTVTPRRSPKAPTFGETRSAPCRCESLTGASWILPVSTPKQTESAVSGKHRRISHSIASWPRPSTSTVKCRPV